MIDSLPDAQLRFLWAVEQAQNRPKAGIGTLGEKSLHACLKLFLEPHADSHEIKIGGYVADVVGENGIMEIQTRQFDRLRQKLEAFLQVADVTVVYPIAQLKWLVWLNPDTGETTPRRRSPKKGRVWDAFPELYKITPFLKHPRFHLLVLLLEVEEHRLLNGWSKDRKKGSVREERYPCSLMGAEYFHSPADFARLIPAELIDEMTSGSLARAAGVSRSLARCALRVMCSVGAIERDGKLGRQNRYRVGNVLKEIGKDGC